MTESDLLNAFFNKSWCRFSYDPALAEWVERSISIARKAVRTADMDRWLRCGGTWFVGVNALPNDAHGAVEAGLPLSGSAFNFIRETLGLTGFAWDQAQLSICYPGYPRRGETESEANFRYRRDRAAAHVDGLLPEGPDRRRHLREYHGFLLGIPMVETSPDASPFVVWEGSHEIVRETFAACFDALPPQQWGEQDITDAYHDLRRGIFKQCPRVELWAKPGEAYLVHRLSLHGMAPWGKNATAPSDGRMICYFRPEIGGPREWLTAP